MAYELSLKVSHNDWKFTSALLEPSNFYMKLQFMLNAINVKGGKHET